MMHEVWKNSLDQKPQELQSSKHFHGFKNSTVVRDSSAWAKSEDFLKAQRVSC